LATQEFSLGVGSDAHEAAMARFERSNGVRRLWARDASLWTGGDEASWLGWLDLPEAPRAQLDELRTLADAARREGVRDVVVLGMGGSSLCPDVLSRSFAPGAGRPRVLVLDSTVPAQIAALDGALDLDRTWFVVSSKSGGTIEPNSHLAWFHARCVEQLGADEAGRRFVAITDPGSSLEQVARERGFRATVAGIPSVGGRFSALSAFGLLPAALQGIDLDDWLGRARAMARACGADVPARENAGVALGVAIGALAATGRDKLVLAISPALATLGGWLEQLVAESTGKHGTGVVPIDGEPLPAPGHAGDDRLFVYTRVASAPDAAQDAAALALEAAGLPVIRIGIDEPRDLAGEMFRWEVATAVAGAVLGIDPFDQPDVESAKVEARALMAAYERDGALPDAVPLLDTGEVALYGDPGLTAEPELERALTQHLSRARPGDYLAINAFVAMDPANAAPLERLRRALGRQLGLPTTLGYGPRFLHSTGQLHKGGPDRGVFLTLTADDAHDLPVPGQAWTFGVLKQAQALGDHAVLCERGRRALRVHLRAGRDVAGALDRLAGHVERALAAL
jgi:transaldolase/glucose-6-phosphate isomerase